MTELRVTIPDDVAERLASEAAERGTSAEDLAADLLRRHLPVPAERSLSFIGIADALPGAPSAAEAERQLEDGADDGFPP
jgi:plasmid stability protein